MAAFFMEHFKKKKKPKRLTNKVWLFRHGCFADIFLENKQREPVTSRKTTN